MPKTSTRSARPPAIAPSTKEQLVLTAERLFALHGLDGVSLRQICAESGTANNSAVQYHFGSKEHLVQAIFEHRIPGIMRRRRLLTGVRGRDDLRSCVEAYLIPVLEEAEDAESYYLTFLMQLQRFGVGGQAFDRMPKEFQAPTQEFVRHAGAFLVELPEPLRPIRVVQALAICTQVCADRQLALSHKAPVMPYALHSANLFDGIVGFLESPPSRATLDALDSARVPKRWRTPLP